MHLKWDSIDKHSAAVCLSRKAITVYTYTGQVYLKGCFYSTYRDPAGQEARSISLPSSQSESKEGVELNSATSLENRSSKDLKEFRLENKEM
jgi:hypothetical protein